MAENDDDDDDGVCYILLKTTHLKNGRLEKPLFIKSIQLLVFFFYAIR